MSTQSEEADDAIELSAQDLVALSAPIPGQAAEPKASIAKPGMVADERAKRPPTARVVPSSRERHPGLLRVTLAIAAVAAVVTVGAVFYGFRKPTKIVAVNWSPAFPQQRTDAEMSEPEVKPEGKPVRFANPFDSNEVFEFPPGTSKAEARDAVAILLLERAQEREARLQPRRGAKH